MIEWSFLFPPFLVFFASGERFSVLVPHELAMWEVAVSGATSGTFFYAVEADITNEHNFS